MADESTASLGSQASVVGRTTVIGYCILGITIPFSQTADKMTFARGLLFVNTDTRAVFAHSARIIIRITGLSDCPGAWHRTNAVVINTKFTACILYWRFTTISIRNAVATIIIPQSSQAASAFMNVRHRQGDAKKDTHQHRQDKTSFI